MAAVKACPICNDPVTFGGGRVITNIPSGLTLLSAVICGLKYPSFSHHAYHDDSTAAGLYFSNAPSSRLCNTILNRRIPGTYLFCALEWLCH